MPNTTTTAYDVAIIGGGPGGSTTGALLKKYNPDLRVVILEREKFPREHIGESQLPPISDVLQEMGCWDDVEAAGFPIKVGATFTWGKTVEPWDFEFLPIEECRLDQPRPAKYEGWRRRTAFQVERSIYDEILLNRAAALGCDARQETKVAKVHSEGDRVTALELESGERITARHYIDASGNAAILRRRMGVKVDAPTLLRNVAFWDYWMSEDWAGQLGISATRIHIRSLPYGWIWFIPVGAARVSVGLVCPADYYKKSGKRPEQLYIESLESEKMVGVFTRMATRENNVRSTNDWSFVAERTYGENWFLVGEAAGFADPILSAGMTLAHTGGRELAYTILELDRGELEREWLLERYDELQIRRVRQHMRFADYWYSANGIFDDVRENCINIAREAGLKLGTADAFRWLAQGGFGDDSPGQVGIGGLDVAGVKQVMMRLHGGGGKWMIDGKNVFKLNLSGATEATVGLLHDGRIERVPCWIRGESRIRMIGLQGIIIDALQQTSDAEQIMGHLRARIAEFAEPAHVEVGVHHAMQTLEVMANEWWVMCSVKKNRPTLNVSTPYEGRNLRTQTPDSPSVPKFLTDPV